MTLFSKMPRFEQIPRNKFQISNQIPKKYCIKLALQLESDANVG